MTADAIARPGTARLATARPGSKERPAPHRRERWRTGAVPNGDHGNAVVEFLAAALLLLLPVLYLVLVLGRLQAATFAAEGAAREAGRSFTTATSVQGAPERAVASVRIALDDQGFEAVDARSALAVTCSSEPCLVPGSDVQVRVAFDVVLPGVPSFVHGVVPLAIPVTAEHVAPVDTFAVTPATR
ncbi:pilus assembly protein [Cellulomonas sp. ATA003]|uniref:pilus assembly protein n=1 Tax=Cellulomonas sp. ATA003 TaxID=3073064 RepID=UPI00287341F6|nr:pilus assembly protein [Cellulomonas sp. ATA003]WNB86408.1 pilus assembly protein [Cellulomonas sp. ATA003]